MRRGQVHEVPLPVWVLASSNLDAYTVRFKRSLLRFFPFLQPNPELVT